MEHEVKASGKEAPKFVAYLWEDLSLEERELRLEAIRRKRARKANRPEPPKDKLLKYKPFEELDAFYDEMELEFGLQLDDGWFRLCALHQFETFVFFSRERYEAEWTTAFSKNYKATRGMREWPRGARSKTNPWKHTSIYEVMPLKIEWVEEHRQYKVVFEFARGVTQTFWFPPEFKDSSLGEGWVTPRYISKFHPWVKSPRR